MSGTSSVTELDFELVWNKLHHANLRGWCDSPIDFAVRRLQSIQRRMRVIATDQLPFQGQLPQEFFFDVCRSLMHLISPLAGDLKILISPELVDGSDDGFAALRLREGEDESCLWHLRCEEGGLRATIRTLLTDA